MISDGVYFKLANSKPIINLNTDVEIAKLNSNVHLDGFRTEVRLLNVVICEQSGIIMYNKSTYKSNGYHSFLLTKIPF